jgi:hypothetical protein
VNTHVALRSAVVLTILHDALSIRNGVRSTMPCREKVYDALSVRR